MTARDPLQAELFCGSVILNHYVYCSEKHLLEKTTLVTSFVLGLTLSDILHSDEFWVAVWKILRLI